MLGTVEGSRDQSYRLWNQLPEDLRAPLCLAFLVGFKNPPISLEEGWCFWEPLFNLHM